MAKQLYTKNWDYSLHAKYYEFRPNYSDTSIEVLLNYVGAKTNSSFLTADIGAGTGNLTILLAGNGLKIIAIEPNDEMRAEGLNRSAALKGVKWLKANGVKTTLDDRSVNWVTFGSSFNVMDRDLALKETHRILKQKGFFSCLWNHRKLEDPVQQLAEEIIIKFVPDYDRGVRREDQRPLLEKHSHKFKDIFYFEADFQMERTINDYISAWKSVKNKYWDLSTSEGVALFDKITSMMRRELPSKFNIGYTTRAWTAQKK